MPAKNKRHTKWAQEHIPLLQARGEDVTARLVARAVDETQTLRVILSMVLAVSTVGAGWIIDRSVPPGETGSFSTIATGAILIGLLAYVGTMVSDGIVHKRIKELANA